jgi:hypothetical protein
MRIQKTNKKTKTKTNQKTNKNRKNRKPNDKKGAGKKHSTFGNKPRSHKNPQSRKYNRSHTKRDKDLKLLAHMETTKALKGSRYPVITDIGKVSTKVNPKGHEILSQLAVASSILNALTLGPHPDVQSNKSKFINPDEPAMGLAVPAPDDFVEWGMFENQANQENPDKYNRDQKRQLQKIKKKTTKNKKDKKDKKKTASVFHGATIPRLREKHSKSRKTKKNLSRAQLKQQRKTTFRKK